METPSPENIRKKVAILENNLFQSVKKQTDKTKIHLSIERAQFLDVVILKAIFVLMAKFNINNRDIIYKIKELLDKEIHPDATETFEDFIQDNQEIMHEDLSINNRSIEAIVTQKKLDVYIKGIPERKTVHGRIVKSFFKHERSPGKLLKDGLIDFREINKFPVVNSGDQLFFIGHEQQGIPGVSFDGQFIPVEDAKPYEIRLKEGVEIIDTLDEHSDSNGYYIRAMRTGVVMINRDDDDKIKDIEISDEIDVSKLDYSTGNIGTEYSCPINMNVGVICNGFNLCVNGTVRAKILDGGKIQTSSNAIVEKMQADSKITAGQDVTVDSSINGTIISENGTISLNKELIDSKVTAPKIVFEKSRGILTSSLLDTENIVLKNLYLRGENVIRFGNALFKEQKRLAELLSEDQGKELEMEGEQKGLMEKLQLELKKITRLAQQNPALSPNIKGLILATRDMNFATLFQELDAIQKMNSTRVVGNTRKILEDLEQIPGILKKLGIRIADIYRTIKETNQRLTRMKLAIQGDLSPGASIKVFCGIYDKEKPKKPDYIIDSEGDQNKTVNISGTYTVASGFRVTQ